jgi:hypothetical protein
MHPLVVNMTSGELSHQWTLKSENNRTKWRILQQTVFDYQKLSWTGRLFSNCISTVPCVSLLDLLKMTMFFFSKCLGLIHRESTGIICLVPTWMGHLQGMKISYLTGHSSYSKFWRFLPATPWTHQHIPLYFRVTSVSTWKKMQNMGTSPLNFG